MKEDLQRRKGTEEKRRVGYNKSDRIEKKKTNRTKDCQRKKDRED